MTMSERLNCRFCGTELPPSGACSCRWAEGDRELRGLSEVALEEAIGAHPEDRYLGALSLLIDRARSADLRIRCEEYPAEGSRHCFVSVIWPPTGKKHVAPRVLIEEAGDLDEAAGAILDRWKDQ